MGTESEAERDHPSDEEKVRGWRLFQCSEYGIDFDLAERFAAGRGDLHRLADLIADGCSPNTAARILDE